MGRAFTNLNRTAFHVRQPSLLEALLLGDCCPKAGFLPRRQGLDQWHKHSLSKELT